jgi:UDP-N-acetylglucosamine diphosphorylase/glucosamine-1-phosphate N-acetyltransferase
MQQIILLDREREHLLPIVFTRSIGEIRIGILTIREKWEKYTNAAINLKTAEYLQNKYTLPQTTEETLWIDARILPNKDLVNEILKLEINQILIYDNNFIAVRSKNYSENIINSQIQNNINCKIYNEDIKFIKRTWDIFSLNGEEIIKDFELLTRNRQSENIPNFVYAKRRDNIFIEKGVKLSPCSLDAEGGCIYLGKNSEIMDFATIKGPVALGEHSQIKAGAKIYSNTTIGPHCKIAGELNNVIFQSYSNKAHEGFIGNAYIGEWCNIGADSNNSNLKNTYEKIKMWNYALNSYEDTGLQFAGLIMGDHTKLGINTMLNTGTVIGCSCNIFGAGFPRTFIPSFRWGGASGLQIYDFNKAILTATNMMYRRDKVLSNVDIEILKWIFDKETF